MKICNHKYCYCIINKLKRKKEQKNVNFVCVVSFILERTLFAEFRKNSIPFMNTRVFLAMYQFGLTRRTRAGGVENLFTKILGTRIDQIRLHHVDKKSNRATSASSERLVQGRDFYIATLTE